MAEEILGISGHLDASDIIKSFDEMLTQFSTLEKVSKETAQKVQKTYQDVANASEKDLAQKSKEAIVVFSQAFEEAQKNADKEVAKIEGTITRLQTRLQELSVQRSETVIGTKTYDNISRQMESLNTQIHNQQALLAVARDNALSVGEAYTTFTTHAATANSALDIFRTASAGAAITTGANAAAHAANAGAIGAEALSTAKNTEEIIRQNEAQKESIELSDISIAEENRLTDAQRERLDIVQALVNKFHELRDAQASGDKLIGAHNAAVSAIDSYGLNREDYDLALPQRQKKAVEEVTEAIREQKNVQNEAADSEKSKVQQLTEELAKTKAEYNKMIGLSEDANRISVFFRTHQVANDYNAGLITDADMSRIIEAHDRVEKLKQALKEARSEEKASTNTSSKTSSVNVDDMRKVEDSLKSMTSEYDALLAKISKLESADALSAKQRKELEDYRDKLKTLGTQLDETRNRAQQLRSQTFFGNVREKIDNIDDGFKLLKGKLVELVEKVPGVKSLENGISKVGDAVENAKKKASGSRFAAEYQQAKGILTDFGSEVGKLLTGNGKFQESLKGIGSAFGGLLAPISAATAGLRGMVVQMARLAMTPLGAVIAAIVLAFKALHSWLTKSAEGQRAYARISAYLGSLLSSLTDILVKLGGYLYHAFADANAPMNGFAKGMITTFKTAVKTVVDLLSGLGNTIKGIFTTDWDTFSKGISQTWDAIKGAGETVVNSVKTSFESLKGIGKIAKDGFKAIDSTDLLKGLRDMNNAAKTAGDLAVRELDAQKQLSEAKRDEHLQDIKIAEEREKIYTLTGKAKDEQIEYVKQLIKEKYNPQIEAQQSLLHIQQQRNRLHSVSLEQLSKERETQGAVYALQAQQASSTRMLVRMQQANLKSMANADKKDNRQQQQIDDAHTHWEEVVRKNALARATAEEKMEQQITDARIAAMKDGGEKYLAEKNRQLEKEIQQIDEQRKAAFEAERARQKAEFEAQEKEIKARGGKPRQWSEEEIDKSEIDKINAQFEELKQNAVQRQQNDEYRQQLQAMRDYLKEYGTFQQQKLAIAEEYAEKIAKAQAEGNQGEVLRLHKEQQQKTGQAKANELARGIDFTKLIGGVGDIAATLAKETYDRIQAYKKEDEYKNSTPEQKQAIANLEEQAITNGALGNSNIFGSEIWNDLKTSTENYKKALSELDAATEQHTQAEKDLEEAQKRLAEATPGTMDWWEAKYDVSEAQQRFNDTGTTQQNAQNNVQSAGNEVKRSLNVVSSSLKNFDAILGQITSGSLSGFATGMFNLVRQITGSGKEIVNSLSEAGDKAGGIIGAILNIIDAIGDDAGGFLSDAINKVFDAIVGVIDQLLSGELLEKIGSALMDGIVNLIDSLTFGLFGLGDKDEKRREEERKEKLEEITSYLEHIEHSLDKAIEKLEKSLGVEALASAKDARERLVSAQNLYKEGWYTSLPEFSRWMSEMGVYIAEKAGYTRPDGYTGNFWEQQVEGFKIADLINGLDIQELSKILADIRDNNGLVWSWMVNWGDDSHTQEEWLTKLAESATKGEEIEALLKVQLTTTNEDELYDSFMEYMYSIADGAEDVEKKMADDWQKMMNKMVVNDIIGTKSREALKKWYAEWSNAVLKLEKDKENGKYEGNEIEYQKALNAINRSYTESYQSIVNEAKSEIDRLREMGIVKDADSASQQSATANSIQNISYDQADSLVGIGLNHTILLEQSLAQSIEQTEALHAVQLDTHFIAEDMHNVSENVATIVSIQDSMNDHLAKIELNTNVLPEMADDILKIRRKVDEQ